MQVAGERKFTGIIHDLSARVRMEEQLREQAAMVHLGEMAAVIAHEIKNPLAGMRGAIQVIASRMPEGRDGAVMQEIVSRIDGLNELMNDLLLFSRPPQPHARATDIGRLVTDTADMLVADPEAAAMTIEVNGNVPLVSIDPDLMKIVFVNLLANASHAMNGRGTICVSLATGNSWCQIGVADSGPGIPEAIRQQIFKPFFTTKSRGSGLGLPTVKRLVEAHGGRIAVDCPPGGGTTVTIQLPA
jgi:two-component system sensor histidine kinase PilS (NtrC family)